MDSPNHILNRIGAGADFTESYGPLKDQVIDFYNFEANTDKVVVLIHGGFWKPEYDRAHLRTLAGALSKDGHRVALLEYRRSLGEPDASTSDVKAALKLLQQMSKSENSRLILVGHSAGGQLALWAAVNSDYVGAVIALAPVANFLGGDAIDLGEGAIREFLGEDPVGRPDLDPIQMSRPTCPTVVIHGVEDTLPIHLTRSYMETKESRSAGIKFIEYPGIGHFELIDPEHDFYHYLLTELELL